MLRVSALSSQEYLLVLRGLRNLDRDTKKHLRRGLKQMAEQAWKELVARFSGAKLEQIVLAATARVRVSDQNVRLTSASLSRSLSGGLKPSANYHPVEFGANPAPGATETATSRRGKKFDRKRDPMRPFPAPRSAGPVYRAAAQIIPRILAMYVQTFVRAIHDALEGKSS